MIDSNRQIWAVIHHINPFSIEWEEASEQPNIQLFTNRSAAYAYAIECYLKTWVPLNQNNPTIQNFLKLPVEEAYQTISNPNNKIWADIRKAPKRTISNIQLIADNGVPLEELYDWAELEEQELYEFEIRCEEQEQHRYIVILITPSNSWTLPPEWNLEHWNTPNNSKNVDTILEEERQQLQQDITKQKEHLQELRIYREKLTTLAQEQNNSLQDQLLLDNQRLLKQLNKQAKELNNLKETLYISAQKLKTLQHDNHELEEDLLRLQSNLPTDVS